MSNTAFGLNPAGFYPIIALIAVLGIVITAAYILRAVGSVFFGEYEEHRWHDMRPLIALDKVALAGFVAIMIVIGLFPSIIAPIVESGITPVVERLQEAQQMQASNITDTVQMAAKDVLNWLGGV